MSSLSDKLKSLGVKVGAGDRVKAQDRVEARDGLPHAHGAPYAIEQVMPGRFETTPFGEVFVVEKVYPPDYQHGRTGLWVDASLRTIAEWANDGRIADCSLDSFVFLDTETTGLAGGTGTYAFLIGVGRFEEVHQDWGHYNEGHFRLTQFFMRDPVEEAAQLAALAEFLQPCDALVTFNGKAFDLPLLEARFITNGEAPPLGSAARLDLLHLARRLWRERLASRTLGQLEQHILEASRTHEDIPGWLIPSVYFDYLRSGDARPLKSVFYHNAMDVLAMAALLNHMANLLDDPLDGAIEHALDLLAMAKLFEHLGQLEAAVQLYRQSLQLDLPEEKYWESLRRLSFVQRRRGKLPAALALWQEAAEGQQLYAHVELAKFYEHKARDFNEASRWTRAALALIDTPHFSPGEGQRWRSDLEHRLARLQRKLKRSST